MTEQTNQKFKEYLDIEGISHNDINVAQSEETPRKISRGTDKYTEIYALDEKGAGGANHKYVVECLPTSDGAVCEYATVRFQQGAIKENGVNGCQNEDLIAIVIDRLKGFQSGNFSCRENAVALTKLEEALMWLNKRTNDRIKRGVEGKNIK